MISGKKGELSYKSKTQELVTQVLTGSPCVNVLYAEPEAINKIEHKSYDGTSIPYHQYRTSTQIRLRGSAKRVSGYPEESTQQTCRLYILAFRGPYVSPCHAALYWSIGQIIKNPGKSPNGFTDR
jgi:hypothetical protein